MAVRLKWITPDVDQMVGHMARVSNPSAKADDSASKLIQYLIDHQHWSPFEMACMCLEVVTTRDIARQILRHRSFHFQEFSQRYAEVSDEPIFRDIRLQDAKNRQNSVDSENHELNAACDEWQREVWQHALMAYTDMLRKGVAKEVARVVLPEGLTPTRLYMQGTLREWLHYVSVRASTETQKEHREIATEVQQLLKVHTPTIYQAAYNARVIE